MVYKNKNILLFFLPLFLLLGFLCTNEAEKSSDLTIGLIEGKKIAIVVGQRYFKDEELTIPKTLFEKEGGVVTIVSSKLTEAEGDAGTRVKPDITINDLEVKDFDAIVFIGGTGVKRDFWDNPAAHAVSRETVVQGKLLAAICWGPVVLAKAGVLEGRKATSHVAGDAHEILKSKGCEYTGESVTIDGNIITAYGPSSADSFAVAIIQALK